MQQVSNWAFLIVGTFVAALGLAGFLIPNHFIDGGITGVSMLLSDLTGVPLPVWLVAVNVPFLWVGYRIIGAGFAVKSSIAILLLALLIAFVPFPIAISDKLLGAVFGGFFLGAGVGLAIRSGGVLDGTEILAVILSSRTFATVGEIILVLNVGIFSVAAYFLGVESALYSMLTYFAASKTVDYLLHGIEAFNGVMIVTEHRDEVRNVILNQMNRGVTNLKSMGGYSGVEQEVLFCVVTRLEIPKLEGLLHQIDPKAFTVVLPVLDVHGGVIKKRVFH